MRAKNIIIPISFVKENSPILKITFGIRSNRNLRAIYTPIKAGSAKTKPVLYSTRFSWAFLIAPNNAAIPTTNKE